MSQLFTAEQIQNATFAQAKQMVRDNLRASDAWLVRGLLAIFKFQTPDERASEFTKYDNDVGFNAADAEILTSFAKQWERRQWLSPDKQIPLLRRKMLKYAGQLTKIAQANRKKAGVVTVTAG